MVEKKRFAFISTADWAGGVNLKLSKYLNLHFVKVAVFIDFSEF